ncbi:MAG: homoserine O-succinyltransferase [Christensenellales bacterium]
MPIVIPRGLPAFENLQSEKIFVMDKERAVGQDIRPIEIAILNLMPTKETTETQLIRLLSNSPLQINVTLIKTDTYEATHASPDHMTRFYKSLDEIQTMRFDGMIVTGAPVETIPFEEVKYWKELEKIIDFADSNVTSTIYICWGAQAALYHKFGVTKHMLDKKLFGIFPTHAVVKNDMLLKGMDDTFYIPSSRHTGIDETALRNNPNIKILAEGDETGVAIAKTIDNKSFFFTGHSEYDRYTLRNEYLRDLEKGLPIERPKNYFADDDVDKVDMKWRSTANLLFYNWLNYYVYQVTPFNLHKA